MLQEIMAREQELLLEEFTRFVGLLDNRTDLTVQHAKAWNMDELMENIHPVRLVHNLWNATQQLPFALHCHQTTGIACVSSLPVVGKSDRSSARVWQMLFYCSAACNEASGTVKLYWTNVSNLLQLQHWLCMFQYGACFCRNTWSRSADWPGCASKIVPLLPNWKLWSA